MPQPYARETHHDGVHAVQLPLQGVEPSMDARATAASLDEQVWLMIS